MHYREVRCHFHANEIEGLIELSSGVFRIQLIAATTLDSDGAKGGAIDDVEAGLAA